MQECTKCNINKQDFDFYKDRKMLSGLKSWCKDCCNELRREIKLKNSYGVSLEEYDELFKKQNGVCAVCKRPETATHSSSKAILRLAVDHNHTTGEVRGLLCRTCNTKLISVIENHYGNIIELLNNAINYLGR